MKTSKAMSKASARSASRVSPNGVASRRIQRDSIAAAVEFLGTTASGTTGVALSAHEKPARNWREIAQEASTELDPERLMELASELTRALDEQINSTRRWPRSKVS